MTERPVSLESKSEPRPSMLDLICLDGRWAQVFSGPFDSTVGYLDDGSRASVDLREYRLTQVFNTHVEIMAQVTGHKLTAAELARIHTGVTGEGEDEQRLNVRVFGEYQKKLE